MCISTGNSSNKLAEQERADEQAKEAAIAQGTQNIDDTFSQFNDDFYNQRAQSYEDYAEPQLDDQYASAKKDLTYALANAGLINSSASATELANLEKQYATQKQNVADTAQNYATQAKSDIETARSNLVNQLNSTGDASAAASGALSQAQLATATPSYTPLAQVFQNITSGIGAATNTGTSGSSSSSGVKLYSPSTSSGTVVSG